MHLPAIFLGKKTRTSLVVSEPEIKRKDEESWQNLVGFIQFLAFLREETQRMSNRSDVLISGYGQEEDPLCVSAPANGVRNIEKKVSYVKFWVWGVFAGQINVAMASYFVLSSGVKSQGST